MLEVWKCQGQGVSADAGMVLESILVLNTPFGHKSLPQIEF